MYYIVVYRISREQPKQFGPFTTEESALDYCVDNADRTWLGVDMVKIPGTIQAFRVMLLGTAFLIGFNPKVRKRVVSSILHTEDVRKLIDIGKLLNAIEHEQKQVQQLRKQVGSCEFCPADGGGCVVCS